ncbi:MAG: hypothetical protein LIO93_09720 [Bacteroidales bacterium]|nr:hypothetical protein [Bacteroidales bacterium]
MENEIKKVEFYKIRSIGERFSAAGDFVRQNWKLLLRNVLYIGVPLAIVQGYFAQEYTTGVFSNILSGGYDISFFVNALIYVVLAVCLQLFLYSMTGAILYQYTKNTLTENSGWNDLKGDMFSIMGKLFVQGLIISVIISALMILIVAVFFLLGANLMSLAGSLISSFIILGLLVLCIVLMPSLVLASQPVFFEQKSAWESLKKGMRLGFKNWGAVFLTVLIGGFLISIFSYILGMPYFVYMMIHIEGGGNFMGYILAAISSVGTVIVLPIFIVFIGLQYTSIIEKEEGVSLQDKISDFDQL